MRQREVVGGAKQLTSVKREDGDEHVMTRL